jgi:hypothetical protein
MNLVFVNPFLPPNYRPYQLLYFQFPLYSAHSTATPPPPQYLLYFLHPLSDLRLCLYFLNQNVTIISPSCLSSYHYSASDQEQLISGFENCGVNLCEC